MSVRLALTAHARGSLAPAWDGLLAVFDRIAAAPWATAFTRWRDAGTDSWERLDASGWRHLRAALHGARDRAPYCAFEIADGGAVPGHAFRIASIHPMRGEERASVVSLRVPGTFPAPALRELAGRWCDALPVWCGFAGHVAAYDPADRRASWDRLWVLARRYWGVDVQPSQTTTWDALRGLTTVSWLTLVGRGLAEERGLDAALQATPPEPLRIERRENAWMIVAGAEPVIGDINDGRFPSDYAVAYRFLEAALAVDPTELPGRFAELSSSAVWRRRFVDPGEWLEADPE